MAGQPCRRTAVVAGCLLVVTMTAGCSRPAVVPTAPPDGPELVSREPLPDWTPAQPSTFTLVASGDVLIHPPLTEQAETDGKAAGRDFRPMLAGVRDVVAAADLALCHLKVPLGETGDEFTGHPLFNAPPEVATALADAGYDVCSTASNHTLDNGPAGVRSTLDALDAAGIRHTGAARSAADAATPTIIDLGGVRVAVVSHTFGLNAGVTVPAGQPWLVNLLSVDAVLEGARAAKAAGADVVVASLHWGEDRASSPSDQQQAMARRLLADPAVDLIIGHHPNVVQPFERIDGEWVAYGLGNHLARHAEPLGTTEEGVIARFRFGKDKAGRWVADRVDYVPTVIDLGPPIRLREATTMPEGERKETALRRIAEVVRSREAPLIGGG
ncbi:MAG TPA: CapA family protein [Pseudonocardiaceae bacterium]|nr:CapA family protein [Pseudonocardiaceae bacterium]